MSNILYTFSNLRQKVIANESLKEHGGYGGSFSVGCLPRPLPSPKGNSLFPGKPFDYAILCQFDCYTYEELTIACFELERLLCPDRMPSSTIAINRHAQFRPHRDNGAGHGQSRSLIVGFGDYVGGEIVVESIPHDIR
jgi:hypothetical protein